MTPTRRFILVSTLAALLMVLMPRPAAAQAEGEAGAALGPLQLLALFDVNYTPPASFLEAEWALLTLTRPSSTPLAPSLTFNQRAALNNYQHLTFEMSLAATVPLYRGRAQTIGALREQQAEHLALNAHLAYQDALLEFLRDALALSRMLQLADLLDQVLSSLSDIGWRAPLSVAESFETPPSLRDTAAAYSRVTGLQQFLDGTITALHQRLASRTGLMVPVALEPFSVLAQHLVPAAPTIQQCLNSSPMLADVHKLHAVQALEREVQRVPDVRVDLTATSSYSSGGLATTIGLEARVPIPSGWPVSGYVGAAAGLQGADQTLRLVWPSTSSSPSRPLSPDELTQRQQSQLRAVQAELVSLLQSLETSAGSVQTAETQLLWAVADLYSAPDLGAARELANRLTGDPQTDLHLVLLHSDVAFAQISHVESLLTAAAACGTGG